MINLTSEIKRLCEKYGEDFIWGIVPNENGFVDELKREIDISQYNEVIAIARSYSCDEVLFLFDNDIYKIYHLTYFKNNENGFPRYTEFLDGQKVIEYIEKKYIEEYLWNNDVVFDKARSTFSL